MSVKIGTNEGRISHFDTWWVVPSFGLFQTLDDAKKVLGENGIPTNMVKPVTIAICENGLYEPIL